MNDRNRFTEEELALAKTADLTAVASALGYTVQQRKNNNNQRGQHKQTGRQKGYRRRQHGKRLLPQF